MSFIMPPHRPRRGRQFRIQLSKLDTNSTEFIDRAPRWGANGELQDYNSTRRDKGRSRERPPPRRGMGEFDWRVDGRSDRHSSRCDILVTLPYRYSCLCDIFVTLPDVLVTLPNGCSLKYTVELYSTQAL